MMKRLMPGLVAVFLSCTALAEGGTHTQGMKLCGNYFDEDNQNPPCVEVPASFPLSVNVRLHTSGHPIDLGYGVSTPFFIDGSVPKNCSRPQNPNGQNYLYQICEASMKLCGNSKKVGLLPGGFLNDGDWNDTDQSKMTPFCFTDAAQDPHKKQPPDWDEGPGRYINGAIGKCVGEKWFALAPVENDSLSIKRFKACIKMTRAIYASGEPITTAEGVWIEAGTREREMAGNATCQLKNGCFEATWNENGAVCLSRPRAEGLVAAYGKNNEKKTVLDMKKKKRNLVPIGFYSKDPKFLEHLVEALTKPTTGPCVKNTGEHDLLYNRSRAKLGTADCAPGAPDLPACDPQQPAIPWNQ